MKETVRGQLIILQCKSINIRDSFINGETSPKEYGELLINEVNNTNSKIEQIMLKAIKHYKDEFVQGQFTKDGILKYLEFDIKQAMGKDSK